MKYVRRTSYDIKDNFIPNLLKDRGIINEDNEEIYFHPTEEVELNSCQLDNIDAGIKLLEKNLNNKILIIVDSDFDGFSSAALMYNYLKAIKNNIDIDYLLPQGKEHGFQMKMEYLMESKRCDLIIIPDAGSSDHDEMKQLRDFGYEILCLDHHIFDYYDENAVVINNQGGNYPNRSLSGVGVVYKFIEAYDSKMNLESNLEQYLDLVACGETGDMMDMNTLENRYYLKGLKYFVNSGLRGLIKQQAYPLFTMKAEEVTENFLNNCSLTQIQVAFYIVPLINALIRIGSDSEKDILFRAFINGDEEVPSTKRGHKGEYETIAEQAARTCSNARTRQNKEKDKAIELLDIQIIENCLDDNKILILNADELDTPNTLTGLIAMGVAAKYKKPVMLGRINSNGEFKGSIRGRGESELKDFRQLLLDSNLMDYVQGHANAAGYSIKEKNIEKLLNYANNKLENIDFHQGLYEIDFSLNGNSPKLGQLILDIDKYKDVFGQNNDEPIVLIENVPVENLRLVGADKTTINFKFNEIEYVKFKDQELADTLLNNRNSTVNIIGRATMHEWLGRKTPQIQIIDMEFCDDKMADF